MSDHVHVIAPVRMPVEMELTQNLELPPPSPDSVVQLTPDQVQLREAVFSQQVADKESQQVAGLLGIWTGSMLLNDLVMDAMSGSDEEDDDRPQPHLDDDEAE